MQPAIEIPTDGVLQTTRPTLHLADDYPVPLTEPQRRAFQRYLTYHVNRYRSIHRITEVVERGLNSLLKITDRLQKEKEYLQNSLEKVSESIGGTSSNPTTSSASMVNPVLTPVSAAAGATSVTSTGAEPPKRRGFGRFAMIQNALRSAKKEEESHASVLAQREKITKEIRLQQVQRDLDEHLPHHDLLKSKYERCLTVENEAKSMLLPLMSIHEEMMLYEPMYASAFSLRAVGGNSSAKGVTSSDATPSSSASMAVFEIPFKPSVYTSEGEEILRSQIEEVLDMYVGYRSRLDPVLAKLDEEQHVQRAQQQPDSNLDFLTTPQTNGDAPNHSLSGTPADSGNAAAVLEGPESSSDESDDGDVAQGDDVDRQLVQSALTALDDFQDLY